MTERRRPGDAPAGTPEGDSLAGPPDDPAAAGGRPADRDAVPPSEPPAAGGTATGQAVPGKAGPGEDGPGEAVPGQAAAGSSTAGEALPGEPTAVAPPGEGVRAEPPGAKRRRRDPLAAALIGVLTLLLGFAFAVQVRSNDAGEQLSGAREEDLVRILDELNNQEDRLRAQIAEQRGALQDLNDNDGQSAAALKAARQRAQAIGILNGTLAAQGPGLVMTIRDPAVQVRVADVLDAVQELRGAGAETMQIDDVRVGVSTAVTGEPGSLRVDGRPITAPFEFVVIGDPQNMETALNIPGGVVQRITNRGGSVSIRQNNRVEVDALRPLDTPQYASPDTGG